ncbi:MAG: FMN-binding protein [Sedimentisphaerales bacterium]|nr:FMN-binding protein [Sedimentisphaerales bacterium]
MKDSTRKFLKDYLYTLTYAVVLALCCSVLLTGAAHYTKPYQEKNKKAEKNRSILEVLGIPVESDASTDELVELFKQNVKQEQVGELPVYVYSPPEAAGKVKAVAVEFGGPGLWAPIKGFLSLDANMETIQGIVFHEQEETPGLGGDIVTPAFRGQFQGKKLVDAEGNPGIRIINKKDLADNEVAAISGATITCNKVQAMLNDVIQRILAEKQKNK